MQACTLQYALELHARPLRYLLTKRTRYCMSAREGAHIIHTADTGTSLYKLSYNYTSTMNSKSPPALKIKQGDHAWYIYRA